MVRRAVLAIALLLIPGYAWAATRPDAKDAKVVKVAKPEKPDKPAKPATKGAAKPGKKPKKLSRYAAVELFQINTKETLLLRFQDDKGKNIKGWQKRFDKFMRCHYTGVVFKMDARLPKMLYQTARHFEGHRLEVVSGYRHPKIAKNPKSPHKLGLACDFRVAGVANTVLRDYLRQTFDHAGVGYYPNSLFVHLDNRKKGPSAFSIDYSGPGQAADYAENPREDLRNGRVNRVRGDGEEAAGRAEGADDMAQAGEAGLAPAKAGKTGTSPGRKPVEIKEPRDPFGD